MKTIVLIVVLAVIASVLAFNNPTEEQYLSWAKDKMNLPNKKVEDIAKDKLGDMGSLVVSLLPEGIKNNANQFVAQSSDKILKENTVRDNYLICSIYKTNVKFAGFNFHANVLGLMNNFIVFSMGSE